MKSYEKKFKESLDSTEDTLCPGFSYQDLIDVVVSNQKIRDMKAIKLEFRNLLKIMQQSAMENFQDKQDWIELELKNQTKGF